MRRAAAAYVLYILRYMSAQEVVSNPDSIVQGRSSVPEQTNGDIEY